MVVNNWSKYNSVKKLYINATHDETRMKVWHVVRSYYNGDLDKVKDREMALGDILDWSLDEFNAICLDAGVRPVSRQWLYENLRTAADYKSIREKVERKLRADHKPISLRDLWSP